MPLDVLIPLVDGFEEVEAITAVDLLRRAGMNVTTVGMGKLTATGSHQITVQTDALFEDVKSRAFDMIVLPGGPGTKALRADEALAAMLRAQADAGRWIAAICAAPTVLAKAGLLAGRKATCFPGCEGDMAGAVLSRDEVAVDGRIITSRGAGTAVAFALRIVEELLGTAKAADLARQIVFQHSEVA